MTELVLNEAIYQRVILERIPATEKFLWIATADIKDLYMEVRRGKFDSILAVFADLIRDGVEIRLIHAKEPGKPFRTDFDRFPELIQSDRFERILCPRNHTKISSSTAPSPSSAPPTSPAPAWAPRDEPPQLRGRIHHGRQRDHPGAHAVFR